MKKEADKSKGLPPLQLDKHFIEKCWRDQFDKRN
jgi:hypothetical protein